MSPRQRGRHARRRDRSRFQPEPIPSAIPPSLRGYLEAAPEPGRAGQSRMWLHGDGSPDKPSSILLTGEDIRRLCWFLHRMAGVTVSIRRLDLGLEDNASFAAKLAAARLGDDSAGGRWRGAH